jgi:Ca-activated chloride channel family protein
MSPVVIVALVVLGLLVIMYLFGLSPEPARGRRPDPGILRRRSKWRRVLPLIPLLLAVGCLVFAYLGVSFNLSETSPAVVLVMDVSDSMEATDVAPNRLEAAENAANRFLQELPADFRVGLATFAGKAELPVPPTQERDAVVDALAATETSRGTVIGDGLTVALDSIEQIREDDGDVQAAAVLLSDGRDTGSQVSPNDAAARAGEMGVPVYTVLVGQVSEGEGGGGADPETLQAISRESRGGPTVTAETAEKLNSIYEDLGSELSVNLDVESSTTPLVVAAIVLTVVAGLMFVFLPR